MKKAYLSLNLIEIKHISNTHKYLYMSVASLGFLDQFETSLITKFKIIFGSYYIKLTDFCSHHSVIFIVGKNSSVFDSTWPAVYWCCISTALLVHWRCIGTELAVN